MTPKLGYQLFICRNGGGSNMQFVCLECSEDHHEVCIERNANREVPDCDCQHKRVVK